MKRTCENCIDIIVTKWMGTTSLKCRSGHKKSRVYGRGMKKRDPKRSEMTLTGKCKHHQTHDEWVESLQGKREV